MLGVVPLIVLALIASGCSGSDGGDEETSGGQEAEQEAGGDDALALADVCPDPIVVQGSWFSQPEHFVAFELLGEGYEPNAEAKSVSGPLVAGDVDTGVDIEIRAGGPAIGFEQVPAQMYVDESITLGMVATDQIVQLSADTPVQAVMTPFDLDPQIIMWSPEEHPEWNTIADIGQTDEKVLYFEGLTYMSYLIGAGILRESQVDGSFNGSPDAFVASEGAIAVQGYATSEPFRWANETEPWNRPLDYQLIVDTGYPNYGNALAIRSGEKDALAPCLEKLVPILQQATVDYMEDPAPTNELIINVIAETEQGYDVSAELAQYAVDVMRTDALVANANNDYIGDFDPDRLQELLDIVTPIFAGQNVPIQEDITTDDMATNEFIDESISLAVGTE